MKVRLFSGGPEFPAEFLDLIQSGRVVFFCGAGLSAGTGLPIFSNLVRELDKILNPDPNDRFKRGRTDYDRMLSELESRFVPGRMRKHVRRILSKPPKPGTLENHQNILKLAATPGGGFRLVTTNFDDRFVLGNGEEILSDDAPKLPVPESPGWSSLVHLHGRICKGSGLNNLVLNASDFGRAYLSEGWARRFVVHLMRRWPVAFVGYGLNDPPMRYLMDAVYDPRASAEEFCQAFALVGCGTDEEDKQRREWEGKRVTPILYNNADNHKVLGEILSNLVRLKDESGYRAELAQQGTNGNPGDEEGANGKRVVWALRDSIASETFAQAKFFQNPEDGDKFIRWVNTFKAAGLFRADKAASVDALNCPSHSLHDAPKLSPVANILAYWVARHAHQPKMLQWLASLGGTPHPEFIMKLLRFVNKADGVKPKEMPDWLLEMWNLHLQERLALPSCGLLFDNMLRAREKSEWVKTNLKRKILSELRPHLRIVERWGDLEVAVDCQMNCMSGGAYYATELVKNLEFAMAHVEALSAHLEDAALLMKRCKIDRLSLRCFRPEEDDDHYEIPHWLFLTLRVRDAVLGMIKGKDIPRLKKLVSHWMVSEHLLLRRLALFTITETAAFPEQARLPIDWGAKIIMTHPDMLWEWESERESCRFLRKAGARITPSVRAVLERIVRKGPRRSKCRTDLPDEDIAKVMRWAVAKFLAKLELSGAKLSPESVRILADTRKAYPEKKFEEFMEYPVSKAVTSWQTGDPDDPDWPGMPKQPVPKWAEMTAEECADHIQSAEHPKTYSLIKNHSDKAIEVFEIYARRGFWKEHEWTLFLNNFDRNQDIPDKIAVRLTRLLEAIPDESAVALARGCARTMQIISRTLPFSEMERTWHRAWGVDLDDAPTFSSTHHISQLDIAINHAHGQLAEIPLTCLGREEEREKLLDVLAKILAGKNPSHKYGKIVIGGRLFPLLHNFPEWTRQHLLPFFEPDHPMAFGMWEAFLYNPNISEKLLDAFKPGLMHFIEHADDFHQRAGNLVGLFVIAGLLCPKSMSLNEKRRAVGKMSPKGIRHLCWHMERELRDGDNAARAKTWQEKIFPFLQDVWPEHRHPADEASDISWALASLVMLAGDAFPDAFQWAEDFLSPIIRQGSGMHPVTSFCYGNQQQEQAIPAQFPLKCLLFLTRIIPNKEIREQYELRVVLNEIQKAAPHLEKHPEFIRLRKIASGG